MRRYNLESSPVDCYGQVGLGTTELRGSLGSKPIAVTNELDYLCQSSLSSQKTLDEMFSQVSFNSKSTDSTNLGSQMGSMTSGFMMPDR